MKHLKIFEDFNVDEAETGSYAAPKFIVKPAAGDKGYAVARKNYHRFLWMTPKLGKGGKIDKGPKAKKPQMNEASIIDPIVNAINHAKNSAIDKLNPMIGDILENEFMMLARNHGDSIYFYEVWHGPVKDNEVKDAIKNKYSIAVEKAGEEMLGCRMLQYDNPFYTGGRGVHLQEAGKISVIEIKITND